MSGPLGGVRVLDLSHVLNGPYATMFLAHMGADVIKVEHGSGDRFRHAWMPVESSRDGYEFSVVNANKRCITLNLKTDAGRELLNRFIKVCDVLVANFGNATISKFGLTYESIAETNPRMIVARSSGYGDGGPYQAIPALAPAIRAVAGWTRTAWEWAETEGTRDLGIGDEAAGVSLALGICAALFERERSGRGQDLTVSMQEAQLGFMVQALHSHFEEQAIGVEPVECADGYFTLHMPDLRDEAWTELARSLDHPEAVDDPRFADQESRRANFVALDQMLREWMRQKTRQELWDICTRGKVPGAPVLSLGEVVDDPHLNDRDAFVELEQPDSDEKLTMLAPWIRFSRTPTSLSHVGPRIGAHNYEVYQEVLGLTRGEIDDLISREVI